MLSEKSTAVIILLSGLIIPTVLMFPHQTELNFITLYDYTANLLLFCWLPLLAASLLYFKVRPAAVTGAASVVTLLSVLTAFNITDKTQFGTGSFWYIYLIAGGGAFILSLYPAFIRPTFFARSPLRAWAFATIITLISFAMVIVAIINGLFNSPVISPSYF